MLAAMNSLCTLAMALAAAPALSWDLDDPQVVLAPAPPWVQPVEVPLGLPAPAGMARESGQYLLVDDQVRVSERHAERYAHTAYRIVTREGLDSLSRLEVEFDPAWAQVVVHELRVFRDGRWHDRLEGAHATVIREEASLWQHIFDGTRKLVVVMPDVRVGDVVDVSWSVDGLDPVFDGHYSESWPMAWGVTAALRSLRVSWSPQHPLYIKSSGAGEPTVSAGLDGWQQAAWRLRAVPPVVEEYDLPQGYDPYPWVQVSDFAGWAPVVGWALGVYAAGDDPDPAVLELSEQLWAESGDPQSYLQACLRWVQDEVRYFGIELGASSHVPQPPVAVLQRRYGDCKDKSLLLVSLLRARGISAQLALVSRRAEGELADLLPSPTVFDHVIAVARLDGRDHWLDPTESDQGGPVAESWIPSFRKALVVAPGSRELTTVPLPALPQGRAVMEHSYDLLQDVERPRIKVEARYEGRRAEEMRRLLADISLPRLQENYVDHYAQMGFRVTPGGPLAISDERDLNLLRVRESWILESGWELVGVDQEQLVLPPASIFDWLPVSMGARLHPLALPMGLDELEQVTVLVDPEWELDPVEADVLSPWFHLEVSSESQPGSLVLSYHLQVLRDRVAPAELDAYHAALEQVYEAQGYSLLRDTGGSMVPWDIVEKVVVFLVVLFAVLIAVPVSLFAAAVLVWLGLPRRAPLARV